MSQYKQNIKIVVTGTRGIPNIQGGVETHCEELFPRVAAHGYETIIIRRKSYAQDDLKEYKNVKLFDIPTPRKKSLEAIIHTLKAAIAARFKFHADILHVHAIGPALVTPFARLLGMKVVFTHHGHDYERNKWGAFAKFMLKFGERMGCRFANKVIVISETINRNIKERTHREDAYVIYNGVPKPTFIQETSYLTELGVQPKQYIFAMGRFVPEKNFHHLIQAFTSLKQNQYQLVLAGDADFEDDYSRKLKELARENHIILTGFIKGEKLQSLLTHSRLFVLPSSHEGLPIALLEAMSYNLPVIASNIPPNLNVELPVESYFPVGNPEALAAKIKDFLDTTTDRISYPMEKYNWDAITEQTIEVYQQCCSLKQ
ncbi:MAG: glycosyltransferase family 4 protein [Planctomycetaceae bacterium]|jgi:glycosyltransferase involved in cell wall biosynthesis|nr:glycosyltransferase family 4 protein [Planctomycetaceae bacterium]